MASDPLRAIALGEQIKAQRAQGARADRRLALQEQQIGLQQQQAGIRQQQLNQTQITQAQQQLPQIVASLFAGLEALPSEQRQSMFDRRVQAVMPALQRGVQLGAFPQQLVSELTTATPDDLAGNPLSNFEAAVAEQQRTRGLEERRVAASERQAQTGRERLQFEQTKREEDAALRQIKLRSEQLKAEEGERKATLARKTASDVKALALELAQNPDVGRVFGTIQGRTPALTGTAAAVEAKIDQLVGFLTLDNLGRMSGVLSDSDIRILQNAASILNNRLIPDEVAIAELEKLAGIDPNARKVGKFTVKVKE